MFIYRNICIYIIYKYIYVYKDSRPVFGLENTRKPSKKMPKTQPNSGMKVVLGTLTLRGGTRYLCKLLWYMPNLRGALEKQTFFF